MDKKGVRRSANPAGQSLTQLVHNEIEALGLAQVFDAAQVGGDGLQAGIRAGPQVTR